MKRKKKPGPGAAGRRLRAEAYRSKHEAGSAFFSEVSRDSLNAAWKFIIPGFRAMKTAPNIPITRFGADVQSFWTTEKDLPAGIVPSMIKSWHEVGMNGHFFSSQVRGSSQSVKGSEIDSGPSPIDRVVLNA